MRVVALLLVAACAPPVAGDDATHPPGPWSDYGLGLTYEPDGVAFMLPRPARGHAWYRVADTGAWMEPYDNIDAADQELQMNQRRYDLVARSLVLFIERPPL